MTDELYVARGTNRFGPVSATRLRALAAAGRLRLTDTIWKEGMALPVLVNKVKNLFAVLSVPALTPQPTPVEPLPEPPPALPPALISAPPAPKPVPPVPQPEPARKRRAVAVKGVIILSQDGYHVQYRKKCSACGFEEAARSTMLISNGSTRAHFFCPKCRKPREVEMKGSIQ